MVHNNRVWLRSLAGLDPVDVVIRRVDDAWCDPVELRADSLLGVPGLLEVARRGRVTVLNPLGSGVIESPALTGLLGDPGPRPARRGAGPPRARDLVVRHGPTGSATCSPTSTTWSCCPYGPRPARPPVRPALSAGRPRRPARPHPVPARRWVGQEILGPSTTPTVGDTGALEPRPAVLRTFAVADEARRRRRHHGYRVLPGGPHPGGGRAPTPR